MEGFLRDAYIDGGRQKPYNFTAAKYKHLNKLTSDINKDSRNRLHHCISESTKCLNKIKWGKTLVDQPKLYNYVTMKQLPVLHNLEMK